MHRWFSCSAVAQVGQEVGKGLSWNTETSCAWVGFHAPLQPRSQYGHIIRKPLNPTHVVGDFLGVNKGSRRAQGWAPRWAYTHVNWMGFNARCQQGGSMAEKSALSISGLERYRECKPKLAQASAYSRGYITS